MEREDIEALVSSLTAGHETVADNDRLSTVAVRDGWELKTVPHSTAQAHIFDDLAHLAAFLTRWGKPDRTTILVDAGEVVAVLEPEFLHPEYIRCSLANHPDFDAWRQKFGAAMGQKDFYAHVRAFRETLEADAADVLLAELLKITISRGELSEVEIDERGMQRYSMHKGNQDIAGKIPPRFEIVVPIFKAPVLLTATRPPGATGEPLENPATYNIEILLEMEVGGDGRPFYMLKAPRLAVVIDQARRDAAAYLTRMLGAGWLVGIGKARLDP